MKKLFIASFVLFAGYLIACSPTKTAQVTPPPQVIAVNYADNVHPLVMTHCTPCHIEGKGKMTSYNNFTNASKGIDEILVRINRNPGEPGFMPAKHPKLSDSTIQVFASWKRDGLVEKR